jgi:hypothetical protein
MHTQACRQMGTLQRWWQLMCLVTFTWILSRDGTLSKHRGRHGGWLQTMSMISHYGNVTSGASELKVAWKQGTAQFQQTQSKVMFCAPPTLTVQWWLPTQVRCAWLLHVLGGVWVRSKHCQGTALTNKAQAVLATNLDDACIMTSQSHVNIGTSA